MKKLLIAISAALVLALAVAGVSIVAFADVTHSHYVGEWIEEVPAGCQTEGVLGHYHCDECGIDLDAEYNQLDSLVIPARDHYYIVDTVETVNTFRVDSSDNFTYEEATGIYCSTNKAHYSTGTLILVAEHDASVEISYQVSSESGCDWFTFYYNGSQMFRISGYNTYAMNLQVYAGDVLEFRYSKDVSVSSGSDAGWFSFISGATTEIGAYEEHPIEGATPLCEDDIVCASCGTLFYEALGHDIIMCDRLEPTCTEKGYEAYETCSRCDNGEKVWIEPTGHSYHETIDVPPTCLMQGYTAEICHCGEVLYTYNYVSTISHTYGDWVDAVAPTCTEEGNVGYYPCTACGSIFNENYYMLDTEVVPPRGHWITVPSTATVDALQYVTKSNFSSSSPYSSGYSSNKSHNSTGYIKFNVLYDCEIYLTYGVSSESSYDWFYIIVNGSNYVNRISGSSDRSTTLYLNAGDTLEFKYTKDGSQSKGNDHGYYNMQSGRYVQIDTTQDILIDSLDSRCLEDIVCSCCGEIIKPAIGHDIVQYEYQAPTCTEVGHEAYEACSRCDLTTYVEIPATGHSYETTATEPTCVDQGYTEYVCHCGYSYTSDYVNAKGHYYGQWIPQVDPGCETEGVAGHYECRDCGLYFSRDYYQIYDLTLSPLGHYVEHGEIVTENTVQPNGSIYNFALADDGWYYSSNHSSYSYGYVTFYTSYTCCIEVTLRTTGEYDCENSLNVYVNGSLYDRIVGLGEEKTICIPLYGGSTVHFEYNNNGTNIEDDIASFKIISGTTIDIDNRYYDSVNYVYPTCEDAVICDGCQVEFKAALGHDIIYVDAQDPTCVNIGWHEYEYCSRCSLTTYEEIPANGHSYESAIIDPTCTEDGYTLHTCSVCQDQYTSDWVGMLGHSYTGWIDRLDPTCMEDGYLGHDYCDRCEHYLDENSNVLEEIVLSALGHYVTYGSYEQVQILEYSRNSYFADYGNNYYESTNHNDYSSGYIIFNVLHDSVVTINFGVSSESNYDYFRIYKNGSQIYGISGSYSNQILDIPVFAGDVLEFRYTKDGSVNRGSDCGWFTITSGLYTEVDTRVMVSVDEAEPTCLDAVICESCGVEFKEALGHDMYTVDAQAPGCLEIGWETYEQCSRCEHNEGYVELEPTGHNHIPTVTEPTCEEQGYTTHTCEWCDDYYVDTYTSSIGHNYGEWIPEVEPGCETEGVVAHYHCDACGMNFDQYFYYLSSISISPRGHYVVYGEIIYEDILRLYQTEYFNEPNEDGWYISNNTEAGSMGYVQYYAPYDCVVEVIISTEGMIGGDYFEVYANGYHVNGCYSIDDDMVLRINVNAGAYVSFMYNRDYNGNNEDVAYGAFKFTVFPQRVIDNREFYSVDYIDPTCEDAVVCSDCQVEFKAALGHDIIHIDAQDPDCTNIGWHEYDYCTRCDYTTYDEIPANGHSLDSTVTDPDCVTNGYTTYVCSVCQHTYDDDYVDMLGHDYTGWLDRLDPTCMEDGYVGHNYCNRCEVYLDEYDNVIDNIVLEALGHYVIVGSYEYVEILQLDYVSNFTENGTNAYISTNHGNGTTGEISFIVLHDGVVTLNYGVSSESGFDYFRIYKNGSQVVGIAGSYSNVVRDIEVKAGDTLSFRYTKDGSVSSGSDCGWFTITSGLYTEIDTRVMVSVDDAEPTCVDAVICESCGVEFKEALGHEFSFVDAQDPDCTNIGWYDYEYCTRCDHSTYYELPANGHSYDITVTDPTCTESGYSTYVCTVCDYTYVDDYVYALGHNYRGWWDKLDPTCCDSGYFGHNYCYRCENYLDAYDNVLDVVELSPRGHYNTVGTLTNVYCTERGSSGYFYSTNKAHNSASYYTFIAEDDCVISVIYGVSSEQSFDFMNIIINGNTIDRISGSVEKTVLLELHAGDTVTFSYTKDGSASYSSDQGYFCIEYCNFDDDGFIYIPVDIVEPTCLNNVVCDSCYEEIKPALGHDMYTVEAQAPACVDIGWEEYEQCSRCEHNEGYVAIEPTGHSYYILTVDPNCTELGFDLEVCDICSHHGERSNYTEALGHDYDYYIYIVEPTCTEYGGLRHECHCGEYTTTDIIDMVDHDYWMTEIVYPTCEEEGYTKHICDCGNYYTSSYVSALGHSYYSYTVEATCDYNGYTRYVCDCGEYYDTNIVNALGHDYELYITVIDPTCESDGYTMHRCRCGKGYDDGEIAALGHNLELYIIVIDPTCTEQGYTMHKCRCDLHYNDTYVASTGHSHSSSVVEPTCENPGYTVHQCHCGDTYYDTYVEALGHGYTSVVTPPNCTEIGYTTHTCHCGDVYVDDYVEAIGHTHIIIIIDPTCTTQGYTEHTCDCGDTFVDTYVDVIAHTYIGTEIVEPTCENQGYIKLICDCGDYVIDSYIAALGHSYTETSRTEATCTSYGYAYYICDCGHESSEVVQNILSHTLTSWDVTIDATCSSEGEKERHCVECQYVEIEVISASSHDYNYSVNVIAPTCTDDGYTEYYCYCGMGYNADYVAATGHSYDGNDDSICNGCGDIRPIESTTEDETLYETEYTTEYITEQVTEPTEETETDSETVTEKITEEKTDYRTEYKTDKITEEESETEEKGKDKYDDDDDEMSTSSGCMLTMSSGTFALIFGLVAAFGVSKKKKEDQ